MNHTAAMLKLSDQSDPDLQRYLRHTHTDRHTDRQRFLVFVERCCITGFSGFKLGTLYESVSQNSKLNQRVTSYIIHFFLSLMLNI